MSDKLYKLPELPYGYDELKPLVSEEQLRVHHDKHHRGYVEKANKLLEKKELSVCEVKALTFNVGGHILHSIFWPTLSPEGGGDPKGDIKEEIEKNFESIDRFKAAFEEICSVEGSGWAALAYCKMTDRLLLSQIEKHNVNVYPTYDLIMVLDMWEHAFYIDHLNEKKKHIENFWELVNWEKINQRLKESKG